MRRLEGKTTIVTGASQGTGAVIARRFVEEGAQVVLSDLREERGQELADELGDAAHFVRMDVSQQPDWAAAVEQTLAHFGRIDVLVNNAGILLLAPLDEIDSEQFMRVVAVNQLGPFLGIQAVLPSMKRQGGGSIVNIVSTDGIKGMNGVAAYGSSKWGLRGLTKSAAIELGRYAIRVNAVCPEAGNPNMSAPFFPGNPDLGDVPHQMMQKILKAPATATPESRVRDVANMALFLASDESMSCTAGDFVVDAGLTAGWYQEGVPGA